MSGQISNGAVTGQPTTPPAMVRVPVPLCRDDPGQEKRGVFGPRGVIGHRKGELPDLEKIALVQARKRAAFWAGPTFGEAMERYYREVVEVRRTPLSIKNSRSMINAHLLPVWGNTPLVQVKRRDLKERIREIGTTRRIRYGTRQDGCRERARSTFYFLKSFYIWATGDDGDLLAENPFLGLKQPFRRDDRERVLSADEIKLLWRATAEEGYPYGTVARELLLTGQRRGEVAHVLRHQIDWTARTLTVPIPRSKSRRGHVVPLSDLAFEILSTAPRFPGRSLVFSHDGERRLPSSGFRDANRRIARRMLKFLRQDIEQAGGNPADAYIEPWVFHDLRRTAATLLCQLGEPLHVVDKLLNHAGGRSGTGRTINLVTRVYVKHEFVRERATAMQALGSYITALVSPDPPNAGLAEQDSQVLATAHK